MRRRKWLIALVILLFVAVGFWLRFNSNAGKKETSKIASDLKPAMKVASINITHMDDDKINMTAKVVLDNPYPVELSARRLDYVVLIDSVKVIEDTYGKPITIKSSDSATITMPMTMLVKPMKALLKRFDADNTDSALYTLKASVQAKVPVAGQRKFDLSMDKKMPAVRLFKIKPEHIDVDKLGLKETSLDMVVKVENPSLVPVKFKDAKYKVTVDNGEAMEGRLQNIVVLRPKGSDNVTMHVDMKTGKAAKLAWKSLFDKDKTPFTLDFRCKMISETEALNNSNMVFKIQGTLDDLKKK